MNISQIGLIFDIAGVLILAIESWTKLRVIGPQTIQIGGGQIGGFWKLLFALGYPLLILGFVLQFVGASK